MGKATGGVLLLVEDDDAIGRLVKSYLEQQDGWQVLWLRSGEEAVAELRRHPVRFVVLDIGLPGIDGFEVCRQMRAQSKVPIVMLTARDEEPDRVAGLEIGADDYVSKPFRMEEVLARLRALIRRSSGQVSPELRCGAVALDPRMARVTLKGIPVKLTGHEFRVLSYLMHHRGRVVSQSELTEHIYARDADRDSNTVEVFIARLRRKLGASIIETVRGLGYRIEATP